MAIHRGERLYREQMHRINLDNMHRFTSKVVEEVIRYHDEEISGLKTSIEEMRTEITQLKEDLSEARF